jgi:hypothetical protein
MRNAPALPFTSRTRHAASAGGSRATHCAGRQLVPEPPRARRSAAHAATGHARRAAAATQMRRGATEQAIPPDAHPAQRCDNIAAAPLVDWTPETPPEDDFAR